MSERGSFVTEFIYCPKCLDACRKLFYHDKSNVYSAPILLTNDSGAIKDLPIVAGLIKSSFPTGELIIMEFDLIPLLETEICHSVRICVLAEQGEQIFTAKPKDKS